MKSGSLYRLLENYKYAFITGGILLIYFFNLFIDVMEIDAAQYASISMEMIQDKSFLHVYHRNADYLDKPPLLFWLSSLSMGLFGISNFAYKFPSFLLAILGIYSTYRFTLLYYSKKTAIYAALILATTQALFQITNDLRTDTNLLVFVIFSVWQLALFVRNNSWINLLFGFTGVAFAMMAKGPIGLVTVGMALGFDFLIRKDWKMIFNWKWLVGLVVVAILLIPLTWGLYTQFDLHPEKSAYGIDSPSGVRFFYWTQSFGRITGESSWDNGAGFFYFFHSILWDFQPWILFLILGLGGAIRSLFKRDSENQKKEYITLGGFILIFLALSLSRYKLPHYIFVTFPFAAILAARFLVNNKWKWTLWYQGFFNLVFWVVVVLGLTLIFPVHNILLPIILLPLFIISWYIFFNKSAELSNRIFFSTIVTILGFNLVLATHFYPTLTTNYQSGGPAGRMVHEKGLGENEFYWFGAHDHSLDFYRQGITPEVREGQLKGLNKGNWVYTDANGYQYIQEHNLPFEVVQSFNDYPVTKLNFKFLFESSRQEVLDTTYLLERR